MDFDIRPVVRVGSMLIGCLSIACAVLLWTNPDISWGLAAIGTACAFVFAVVSMLTFYQTLD